MVEPGNERSAWRRSRFYLPTDCANPAPEGQPPASFPGQCTSGSPANRPITHSPMLVPGAWWLRRSGNCHDVGPAPTFGSISSSVRRFQLLVVHDHQASLYDFRIDRSPAPVSRLAQRKNRIPSPSQDQRVESKTSRRRSRCCWATPSVSEATIDPQNQILREEHREAVQTKRPIRGFRIEKRARGGYCDALTYSYPLARILPLAQTQVPPTRRQV